MRIIHLQELNRIQNRPVKMEKTYSKMTEEERKDLIERALEAKNLLEKQLEDTKNQMEEKEKAIQRLQNEVSPFKKYLGHISKTKSHLLILVYTQ